jgi:hypothetical protein
MALVIYAFENELEKGFKEALNTFNSQDTRQDVTAFTVANTGVSGDNRTYSVVTNTDFAEVSTILRNGKKQYYNQTGRIQRVIRYNGTNWEITRYDDDEGENVGLDNIATGTGSETEYPWEVSAQSLSQGAWDEETTFSNPVGGSFTATSIINVNLLIPDDSTTETPKSYIYIETEIGSPASDERENADGHYDHYEADLSFEIVTNRLDQTTVPNDPSGSSSTVTNFHDYMLTLVRKALDGTASAVTTAFNDKPLAVVRIVPENSERTNDEDERVTILNYNIEFIVKVEN